MVASFSAIIRALIFLRSQARRTSRGLRIPHPIKPRRNLEKLLVAQVVTAWSSASSENVPVSILIRLIGSTGPGTV
jgi:hypothetical protein